MIIIYLIRHYSIQCSDDFDSQYSHQLHKLLVEFSRDDFRLSLGHHLGPQLEQRKDDARQDEDDPVDDTEVDSVYIAGRHGQFLPILGVIRMSRFNPSS